MCIFDIFNFFGTCFLFLLIIIVPYCLLTSRNEPIFEIYRQKTPTFYLKFFIAYILLKLRKRPRIREEEAEKLQPFSTHPKVTN